MQTLAMKTIPLDTLCVSDLCVDLVLRGNVRPQFQQVEQVIGGYSLALGGSANIFAAQIVRLGGRAGVIGAAGTDLFGSFARKAIRDLGIDSRHLQSVPHLQTGLGVALSEPTDRAILTFPGSIDAVTPEQLTALDSATFRHWHIASYFLLNRLRSTWPAWCRKLRAHGVTVSLDTNWDPDQRWTGVTPLLACVDVFLPNAAEARAITGESDLYRAGRALAACGPLVVIKDGPRGALAFSPGSSAPVLAHPTQPVPVDQIVDSIGAGDCFDAGFLRAWQLGYELVDCLSQGLRCAEASLRASGGIAGQLHESLSSPSAKTAAV